MSHEQDVWTRSEERRVGKGASTALANEPKGGAPDYSGISTMYYSLIGIVLAYGVYDTFFKKS